MTVLSLHKPLVWWPLFCLSFDAFAGLFLPAPLRETFRICAGRLSWEPPGRRPFRIRRRHDRHWA